MWGRIKASTTSRTRVVDWLDADGDSGEVRLSAYDGGGASEVSRGQKTRWVYMRPKQAMRWLLESKLALEDTAMNEEVV